MYLKIGSQGNDVKTVQRKIGVAVDGMFGPATANKLQVWKRSKGLPDDNVVDDQTWHALLEGDSPNAYFLSGEFASHLNKLRKHLPSPVIAYFDHPIYEEEINSPLRLAHFLAQCSHESGGFQVLTENLNYSAERLVEVFNRHFDTGTAKSYAHAPELIASKVYANRNGNGAEESKDGFLYRGRGFIQLTGKDNYTEFFNYIESLEGKVTNPDLVATKYPLLSAYYYFTHHNIWLLCDDGKSIDVITKITKKINGGINGLDDRAKRFSQFCEWLSL